MITGTLYNAVPMAPLAPNIVVRPGHSEVDSNQYKSDLPAAS